MSPGHPWVQGLGQERKGQEGGHRAWAWVLTAEGHLGEHLNVLHGPFPFSLEKCWLHPVNSKWQQGGDRPLTWAYLAQGTAYKPVPWVPSGLRHSSPPRASSPAPDPTLDLLCWAYMVFDIF